MMVDILDPAWHIFLPLFLNLLALKEFRKFKEKPPAIFNQQLEI